LEKATKTELEFNIYLTLLTIDDYKKIIEEKKKRQRAKKPCQ